MYKNYTILEYNIQRKQILKIKGNILNSLVTSSKSKTSGYERLKDILAGLFRPIFGSVVILQRFYYFNNFGTFILTALRTPAADASMIFEHLILNFAALYLF